MQNSVRIKFLKSYFELAKAIKMCGKHIFRDISNTKVEQNLKNLNQPKSYTATKEQLLNLLKKIDLDTKQFGLHSDRQRRLFKKQRRWSSEKVKDNYVGEDLKWKLSENKNLGL